MENKSGVSRNAVALPSGGGASTDTPLRFSVSEINGSGSYTVPIKVPPGRGSLTPSLALIYNSRSGFSSVALGWSLPAGRIERRLDTGTPTYNDAEDTFLIDGDELLRLSSTEYRPRVENAFRRIRRVGSHWEMRDRSGRLATYGDSTSSRLSSATSPAEVQAWLLSSIEDLNGNRIEYSYRRDARVVSLGPNTDLDANQLYLDKVRYNPHGGGWLHEIECVYDFDDPAAAARPDGHLSYRAGFPIYTGWRLARVKVSADIPNEFVGPLRNYNLSYVLDSESDLSLLDEIVVEAFDDNGNAEFDRPLAFQYSSLSIGSPELETPQGAPQIDFASGEYELVDLTANSLPDIVATTPGVHTFWLNNRWRNASSVASTNRDFEPGTAMTSSPNLSLTQPATHLADVRGQVAADLFADTGLVESPSYQVTHSDILSRNLSWGTPQSYASPAPFQFNDGKTRVVDLTGRGRMDVLRADGNFRHWTNQRDGTYQDQGTTNPIPNIGFTNPEWTFADLNGDGLVEIVRVQNGRIEYFLNKGAGERSTDLFESDGIVMADSQRLRQGVTQWDPERLLFIDLNGNGYDDAVYLHSDKITYWINRAGWGWSVGVDVPFTDNSVPVNLTTNRQSIRVGNLKGTGRPCLIWSSANSPMRCLDLAGLDKPMLLTEIRNGLGGRANISYHSTSQPGIREDTTRVPFTQFVVSEITFTDDVTGQVDTTSYEFLDGNFDSELRQFVCFSEVVVTEQGDTSDPSTSVESRTTTTLFHSGIPTSTNATTRAFQRSLGGRPIRREVAGADPTKPYLVTEWAYKPSTVRNFASPSSTAFGTNASSPRNAAGNLVPEPVTAAFVVAELELAYDTTTAAATRQDALDGHFMSTSYESSGSVDLYGRALSEERSDSVRVVSTVPPAYEELSRISSTAQQLNLDPSNSEFLIARTGVTRAVSLKYAENSSQHLVELIACRLVRAAGEVVAQENRYYDGKDYVGYTLGKATNGNLSRVSQLAYTDEFYRKAFGDWPGRPPDLISLGYRRDYYGHASRRWVRWPFIFRFPIRLIDWLRQLLFGRFLSYEGKGYFIDSERNRFAKDNQGRYLYGYQSGILSPLDGETRYQPDPFYLVTDSETDPSGNTTNVTHNYRVLEPTSVVDPNGATSVQKFDAFGRVTGVVEPGDTPSHPTTIINYSPVASPPPTFVRSQKRLKAGQAATFDSIEYLDGWGRTLQRRANAENGGYVVTDAARFGPRNIIVEKLTPYFDAASQYVAISSNVPSVRRAVDALGRDVRLTHPDGALERFEWSGYSEEHWDRNDTDSASSHYATPTRFVRDPKYRITQVHQRHGNLTTIAMYDYNYRGLVSSISISGTLGTDFRFVYDLLGNRIRVESNDAEPYRSVFNAMGTLGLLCDSRDRISSFEYDEGGRPKARRYTSTSEPPVLYEYCDTGMSCPPNSHLYGRLKTVTDAAGSVDLTYDARGQLHTETRNWQAFGAAESHTVSIVRDSSDNVESVTYPTLSPQSTPFAAVNHYNSGSLLERIEANPGPQSFDIIQSSTYDPRGRLEHVLYGSGAQDHVDHDPASLRVSRMRTSASSGAALLDLRYCYDGEGNIKARNDAVHAIVDSYQYDDLYQLLESARYNVQSINNLPTDCASLAPFLQTLSPASVRAFSYDPSGDANSIAGVGPISYATLNAHPRAEVSSPQKLYRYDDAGSLSEVLTNTPTPQVIMTLAYDSEGRLSSVTLPPDDTRVEYRYDFRGQKASREVITISTGATVTDTRYIGRFLTYRANAGSQQWDEVDQFVWTGERRVALVDKNNQLSAVYHSDLLGSTSVLTDAAGTQLSEISYLEYGDEAVAGQAPTIAHRFSGKERDDLTGMLWFPARNYHPEIARWSAMDPALNREPESFLRQPLMFNPYAYALNNPLTLRDPQGEAPEGENDYQPSRPLYWRVPTTTTTTAAPAQTENSWAQRVWDRGSSNFVTTNKMVFLTGPGTAARMTIGFFTADAVAAKLGTVTMSTFLKNLVFPSASSKLLGWRGVGYMTVGQSAASAVANSVINAGKVALALEVGFAIGSFADAALMESGVDLSIIAPKAWKRWSDFVDVASYFEDDPNATATPSTPVQAPDKSTRKEPQGQPTTKPPEKAPTIRITIEINP